LCPVFDSCQVIVNDANVAATIVANFGYNRILTCPVFPFTCPHQLGPRFLDVIEEGSFQFQPAFVQSTFSNE
jgi:hypothetical protein